MRALFAALNLLSVLAAAQDVSTLPQCGQYCVNTVSAQAVAEANCNVNHAKCYCTRYDFVVKVDSCANSTCTSTSDSAVIDAWVHGYCGDAGSSADTTLTYTSTTLQTSVSPTGSTNSAAAATTTSSPSSSASPSTSDSNSDGGLSTGAKAGIGVGVSVGVLALVGLGFAALWYKRKKGGAGMGASGAGSGDDGDGESKEQVHEIEASQAVGELPGKEPHQQPIMQSVQTPVHELPAGNYVNAGAIGEERR